MDPQSLDQIHEETGVSGDYYNHIIRLASAIRRKGSEWLTDSLRTRPLLRYEEAYPASKYFDTVTEKNRDRVAQINALVDRTNAQAKAGIINLQQVLDTHNELLTLIAGTHNWPRTLEEFDSKIARLEE